MTPKTLARASLAGFALSILLYRAISDLVPYQWALGFFAASLLLVVGCLVGALVLICRRG